MENTDMLASKIELISPQPGRSATPTSDPKAGIRRGAAALAAVSAMATCLVSAPANAADPIPTAAANAGYRMETLASDSFSSKSVDLNLSYGRGFQWYYFNYFGATPTSALTTFNADGSVTVASTLPNPGINGAWLASAGQIAGSPGYRGTAYGGGGYFEATFAFNSAAVNLSQGWPMWWSMSLEHMVGRGQQWPGQRPSYEHFVEPDFFEYDLGQTKSYGGAVHDWYGVYNQTCTSYCNYYNPNFYRPVPNTTDFNAYHRYGLLWKPATAFVKGSLTYYFDGVQTGPTYYYSKFTNQSPVPNGNTPWTYGVIDGQHLVLFIGTCPPVPMQIKSVQVWQASSVNNVHN
jgi:hypothetical protein